MSYAGRPFALIIAPMATAEINDATLAELVGRLRESIPDLQAVYLFGSRAGSTAARGSDIDLAVLAAEPVDELYLCYLGQACAAIAGRDVDLVDLRVVSAVMRAQVVSQGRALWRADTADLEAFEDRVFSEYARLNEERGAILADIGQRGSVHG